MTEPNLYVAACTAVIAYGIATLVAEYDGAFGIFARIRAKFDGSALNCAVCFGFWIIAVILALGFTSPTEALLSLGLLIFMTRIAN